MGPGLELGDLRWMLQNKVSCNSSEGYSLRCRFRAGSNGSNFQWFDMVCMFDLVFFRALPDARFQLKPKIHVAVCWTFSMWRWWPDVADLYRSVKRWRNFLKCPGFKRFPTWISKGRIFLHLFPARGPGPWGPGRVGAVGSYSEEDDESELSELSESSESESESELSDESDDEDDEDSSWVGNGAVWCSMVQLKLWPLKPPSHTPDLASTALSSAASTQRIQDVQNLNQSYSFGLILYLIKIH